MIKIPLSKLYQKKKKFDIKDYKTPFFFNEVKGFELAKYPRFKNKNFWKSSPKHKNKKLLIISGPGRSGNHLLNSLIDGNKSFSRVIGEDSFLTNLLTQANINEKNLIKRIKSGKLSFYKKLSQFKKNFVLRNKWEKVYKTSILYSKKNSKQKKNLLNKERYLPSGNQPGKSNYILDYKGFIPNLDYAGFKNYFLLNKKKFMKIKNIFDFIFLYLDSLKVLMNSEKKNYTFKNIIFNSGMRREAYFILKNHKKSILLCPIREFEGMLLSFLKARHNFKENKKLEKKNVILYWNFWRHKVIDYLILQKEFPKRVFIISYENLVNNPKGSMRLVLKKLKVNFEKTNSQVTIQDKPVLGNSSFNNKYYSKPGRVYNNNFLDVFKIENKVKLSNEYYDILKYLNKKVINKI